MRKFIGLLLTLSMLGAVSTVQAGHLFTQASTNTPINLTAGQGIDIPQITKEGGGAQFDIYFLSDWSAGDIFRIIVQGVSQTFDFDNPFTGASGNSSFYRCTGCPETAALAATSLPNATSNTDPAGTWRFEALAGNFTLAGYRISTVSGKLDGTGAGLVNQVNVTPNDPNQVPVPSVLLLMLAGLASLGLARKKAVA